MKLNRIHIIDDEPVIRESLSEWLSKKYEVLCFSSGEEYIEAQKKFNHSDLTPTCILLDFQMPGMNGVELQNTLKQLNTQFPIIFMSGNALQADIIDAWHGGAIDFILKPFGPAKVSEALEKQFNLLVSSAASIKSASTSMPEMQLPITRREAQVLLLLGGGCSQSEVGVRLGISLSTVKMYRGFLKDKLNLNSLTELIRFCDGHKQSIEGIANQ